MMQKSETGHEAWSPPLIFYARHMRRWLITLT